MLRSRYLLAKNIQVHTIAKCESPHSEVGQVKKSQFEKINDL